MDDLEMANQADGGDTSLEDTETIDTGANEQDDDQDTDAEDSDEEEQPEDEEEVDLDDLKLKLPKSQAEKLRQAALRQADYTRKTQELAEQRKAFEAERDTIQQADATEMQGRARLLQYDSQLAEFAKIDWNRWDDEDPFAAQKAFRQFQLLKDARTQTATALGKYTQERTQRQQQETAKRLEEGVAAITEQIKDWSPDKAAKLMDVGRTAYGFSKEDLDSIDDPRLIIVLNDAAAWRDHQAKQKKVQAAQKQQEVQPAAKPGGGGRPVPSGKLDDRLSASEWVKRRNEQVQKRA